MFTVLIAEKEHIKAITQDNSLFFEPFLENKDLTLCTWNPRGQTLQEAVPGLLDAVGRRKNWRVVILKTDIPERLAQQNPFDVVDDSAIRALTKPAPQPEANQDWDVWEDSWKAYFTELMPLKERVYREALECPLQKLATWLCFRPLDFLLEDTQEAESIAAQQNEDSEIKPNMRLELLEKAQYHWQLQCKERLRRDFTQAKSINIAHPSEVYCISPRVSEQGFFSPDSYWTLRSSNAYSTFADRNLYFDQMRFLVFDVLPSSHRNSRCDQIRFLYTVLVLASNAVPSSALQARKLYRLDSECDEAPLCILATSYDKKLSSTLSIVQMEMDQIRSEIPGHLTDKEAAALFCTPAEVPVTFDESVNPEELMAGTNYGLSADCPEPESVKWRREYAAAQRQLMKIKKMQCRSFKKGVEKSRFLSRISTTDISRLTPFQLEDVREQTESAEEDMIAAIPKSAAAFSKYAQRMEQEAQKVRKVLRSRMSRRATLTAAFSCLGIYLVALLPMVAGNFSTQESQEMALSLLLVSLGVLAGILLVGLFVLRTTVLDAVRDFNAVTQEILNEITSSMDRLSLYLSKLSNVRRGHAVLDYYTHHVDLYTQRLRIRRKHQEDIQRKRAYLQEFYGDFLGDSEYYDQAMICPYELDFDQKIEYDYAPPFLMGDCRQISFLESGNYVTVPSGYITRISVRQEELYDA